MERKTPTSSFSPDATDSLAALGPALPATWLGSAWFENMSDLGSELMSFVADRIKEDVRVQHELLHCKSLTEIQTVQAAFLQKAFDQYQAETGKLVEMTGDMAAKLQPKSSPGAKSKS